MEELSALFRQFPELRAREVDDSGLDPREAGLAHAIVDQTVRRWLTLRHLIQGSLRQRFEDLEPTVAAGLLAGATQIVLLDRIPPWSAINGSVDWVKRRRGKGAAGLVNAVLRRVSELVAGEAGGPAEPLDPGRDVVVLEDGRGRALAREVFDEDLWKRLGQQYSVPMRLVQRWRAMFGDDEARRQCAHACVRAPIVLNVEYLREPIDDAIPSEHAPEGHAVYTGSARSLADLLGRRGDVWVQDAASGAPVRHAAELRPARVLDLCAGRGTKSRQLALAWPEAEIVATDRDGERFEELRRVSEGYGNLVAAPHDSIEGLGAFDLVLLDVPCTNTGVLARRREARYRFSDRSLAELVAIQREILGRGWTLTQPGGHVLYATCSNEREEGEEQAVWAVSALGGVLEREHRLLPAGLPGAPAGAYCDGSYSALLRRP